MRISDRSMIDSVRTNLNTVSERLSKAERQLSSGRRISRPSDDPSATATALRLRTDLETGAQHARTIQASNSRLSAADSALSGLSDLMQRARELTVQGGSGALGNDQLQAVATEINQLIHQAVQLGNTNFGGQYLFAGTKTTTVPFSVATDTPASVTYNGNTSAITQDLGEGVQVRVDVPGGPLFQPVVDSLIRVRDALTAGDSATASTTGMRALDSAMDNVLQTRGSIGARVNRLEMLTVRLGEEDVNLQTVKASLEDIDLADTVIRLTSARATYEAALGAAAKAIQPTLMDFLR